MGPSLGKQRNCIESLLCAGVTQPMILRILSSNSLASLPGSFLRLDTSNVESPNDPTATLAARVRGVRYLIRQRTFGP